MAYFPNGTSGQMYQEQYCDNCIHDKNNDCPILLLHLLWNYDQQEDETKRRTLETFIPSTEDGLSAEQCTMFVEDK